MGLVDLSVIRTINEKIFFLANPNKEIVSAINNISDKQATFKFNGYDEISFKITKKDDTLVFTDDIIDNTLLYVEGIGYFHFIEPNFGVDENGNETLSCTAYSNEYELTQRKLFSFNINTGEVGSIGDSDNGYVTFYNAGNPGISLLHLVLEKFPAWDIGHVDATLVNQQRTFSVDGTSIYDFLTNDVSATLQCIFIFDTVNNLINVYDLNDKERELNPPFGENTNIYISQQNLATAVDLSPLSSSDIVTAVRVRGADNLDIRDANCGFDYMYDLSYYYPTMSAATKTKWLQYLADWENNLDVYSEAIFDANAISSEITKKQYTDYPSSTASSKDYSQYALTYLEQLLENVQEEIDSCDASYYDKTSPDYSAEKQAVYDGYLADKQNIQTAINAKTDEINSLTQQYNQAMTTPNNITQSLEFENYFTVSELEEIIPLIKEGDYTDSNYAVYDNYTPSQILTKKQQLRLEAVNAISELSQPQYSVSTSISNLFCLDEFQDWWDTFRLGDFFTIIFDNDYSMKQRLITVKISNFEDIKSLDVEYSNMTKSTLGISDINALLGTSSSASTAYVSSSSGSSSSYSSSTDGDYVTTTDLNTALINAGLGSGASFNAQQLTILQNLVEGKFDTLSGNFLTVDDFIAESGIIKILDSNIITTDYADITYATVGELYVIDTKTETLTAKVGDISTLMFGSASGNVIQTSFSNSVIAQLGDAQIASAMIADIDAGKIKSGSLYTNLVHIYGDENNNLAIADNTISVSDGTQTRVQIGKDADNDYNMYVWDADGKLMFDALGLTEDGITRKVIRDDVVKDDANISASKLNINSLFTAINEDNSNTLKSSKIYVDDEEQTLDIVFKELSDSVSEQGQSISSQGTSIETIQGQIETKIWQQDITAAATSLESNITTLSTQYSSLSQDLSGFKTTASQTYATQNSLAAVETIATQTADKFNWLVKSGTSATDFTLTDRTATLISDYINLNGLVTFNGLNNDAVDTIKNDTINALEIGGRNLLYKTKTSKLSDVAYYNATTGYIEYLTEDEYGILKANGTGSSYLAWFYDTNIKAQVSSDGEVITDFQGGEYIFSFDCKGNEWLTDRSLPATIQFRIFRKNGNVYENVGFSMSTSSFSVIAMSPAVGDEEWHRVICKITISQDIQWAGTLLRYNNDCIIALGFVTYSYFTTGQYFQVKKAKFEAGNKATDWSPAPEDISVENIYTEGTTLIDGGKIFTGSITADKINVTDLFAQDITATGNITGATLISADIHAAKGLIGGFNIGTSDYYGVKQEVLSDPLWSPVALYGLFAYKAEMSVSSFYQGTSFTFGPIHVYSPSIEINRYDWDTDNDKIDETSKVTVFTTTPFGSYSQILQTDYVMSDLIPKWRTNEATPEGYKYTYYDLGRLDNPWENLFCRNASISNTLHLLSTSDVAGNANNSPPLIIGNRTGAHLEFDANELMSKSNDTTPGTLYLNADGGMVKIGNTTGCTLYVTGATTLNSTLEVSGIVTLSDRLNSSANICLDNEKIYYIRDADGTARTAITLDATNKYSIASGGMSNTIQLGSSKTTATDVYGVTTFNTTVYGKASFNVNDGTSTYARIRKDVTGTTSTVGYGQLTLGNNIPSGTAGNARGRIGLYGTSSGYTMLYPGYAGTSNITINLPSSSGTLALSSSDIRLKENIKDSEVNGLDFINSIKLHQFDWKESGDHWDCGYIADELVEQDIHLVLEGSGGENDDGSINPYCIDDFYLSAYQTKAIQELYEIIMQQNEKIEELRTLVQQ